MLNTIEDFTQKIKYFWSLYREEISISAIIFMVGFSGYILGALSSKSEHPPIEIRNVEPKEQNISKDTNNLSETANVINAFGASEKVGQGNIVASKNGTAYYYLSCSGVKRILDKNKIYFNSEIEAQNRGYHKASGCNQ